MKPLQKPFPWRTFRRVALIQAALVLVAIAFSGLSARYFFKRYYVHQMQAQLRDTLLVLSRSVPAGVSKDWCGRQAEDTGVRLTVADREGKVVCDSQESPSAMGDYFARDEVNNALKHLRDRETAFASAVDAEMFYETVSLPTPGLVIRAAIPLKRLSTVMRVFDTSLGLFLGALAAILISIAIWYAKRLVFPLGRLLVKTQNLISRQPRALSKEDFEEESFGEWSDLESNIDSLGKNLETTAHHLTMEQVELDTIMGAISDAILAVDQDEVPIFYNSRFEIVFGGGGVRRNIKLWEILREPDILKAYKAALQQGKTGGTRAFVLETPGQTRKYFSLAVSPLRKQGGAIYGALGIFHDVTELKSAEQMRIDFVANVSHELRTPLTAIKGYTETLILDAAQGKFDQSAQEFLKIIARNSHRLMNLMEDLLDLSALESTTILQKEVLNTSELTARVVKQLQGAFDAKNQNLEMVFDSPHVNADANRLEQVLINLLDNASKYTPEGGKIRIAWEPDRKGGKDVFLKVQDTGPGIPVEHLGRLFERFYRVDKARSREQGGTGLGLAIVKHIMQRHEGTVWVEAVASGGALFVCRFPG